MRILTGDRARMTTNRDRRAATHAPDVSVTFAGGLPPGVWP